MGQRQEMLVHGRPIDGQEHSPQKSGILPDGSFCINMDREGLNAKKSKQTNLTTDTNRDENLYDPRQGDSCSLLSPLILSSKSPVKSSQTPKRNMKEESHNPNPKITHGRRVSIYDEYFKTLLSALFLASGFITTTISLSFTHDKVPDTEPLPDIVLDNIKYWHPGLYMSEILLIMSTIMTGMLVMLHDHRLIILRRIWFILGILYYYRAITMGVTVLPKADTSYQCENKSDNITAIIIIKRVFTIISGGGLSINGKHVYCGDYIFSGHTMTFTLIYLVTKQYSPRTFFLLHWFSFLTSICGVMFLMIARGHYTIDILLAYFVTTRLWWIYHTLAHNRTLKTQGEHNPVAEVFWWRIFRYFEQNVTSPLPNTYSRPNLKEFSQKFSNFINRILWSRNRLCSYGDSGNTV